MERMMLPADRNAAAEMLDFIRDELKKAGCPIGTVNRIAVAADEIISNIVKFAYPTPSEADMIEIQVATEPGMAELTMIDQGVPFNPLSWAKPSLGSRHEGGLGIFIVRQTMDSITYERKNGCNILHMQKRYAI